MTTKTDWEKRVQLAVDRWYWTPKGTAGTEQLPKFILALLREFAEEAAGIVDKHAPVGYESRIAEEIRSMIPPKKEV